MNRLCRSMLGFALALATGSAAQPAPDVLPAERAFRVSGRLAEEGGVLVRLRAAPGHYLYRDKLRFSAEPSTVVVGAARLPAGQELHDEFFGKVLIYRGEVEIRVPVRLPAGSSTFTLLVRSQGCSDAGVCYTPQEQRLTLTRGAAEAVATPGQPAGSLVDRLRDPDPASR